ncbi:Anther-specific proline-rich protein APG [Zancudomyces culisetae]|uniref:Anther-specific proline-rich protein APG n=1 Tax=Zancudomyces culisetae TaxID=1213189 RepID=A0A1R1PEM4_ZANCU|nr:Anther-specific proline-rich protein APG [Zancudomyces culisetae]|eukprot:OMH79411.1 Anther-specific proline-rich protein APG [Zancudomyces culisetae]
MLAKYTAYGVAVAGLASIASADTRVVVFGNSLSDIGNANPQPKPNTVPWWNGRFSNGPVWNEYLAKWNNYTLINYAVGGATSNNTSVQIFDNVTITVPDAFQQIDTFNATFGGKFSEDVLSNDIAAVEIGGNDVLDGITGLFSGTINVEEYSNAISRNIGAAVSNLVGIGYKRLLVSNIPDISLIPVALTAPEIARAALNAFVNATNAQTEYILGQIAQNESLGVKSIQVLDFFTILQKFQDPAISTALGITNTTAPCHVEDASGVVISSCEDSDAYAFMNSVHPTTRAHSLVGAIASTMLNDGDFKITTESLLDLISKYKLKDISSLKNPLYNDDTYTTGVTNLPSFDIKTSQANATEIVDAANESASNSTSSTTSSSSKSSSSSSSSSSSKSSTSAAGSAKFSFSKLATLAYISSFVYVSTLLI